MAEQLVNEFTVNRPIEEAWPVINDVERIAPCLPGAQLTEIEGDVYRGTVKVKLGSITPSFKGAAEFLERDDSRYHAVLKAEGRDTGGRGNASATITADAESLSPTSTRVVVTTDLHITGKAAQFGRGIIGDVSKKLMAQFANNLNAMLDEQQTTDAGNSGSSSLSSDSSSSSSTAPSDASAAGGSSESSAAPSSASESSSKSSSESSESSGSSGSSTSETPKVRKIDSPASEPVDLAGVAGPALLKRAIPAIVVLLLAVLLVQRRRHH